MREVFKVLETFSSKACTTGGMVSAYLTVFLTPNARRV